MNLRALPIPYLDHIVASAIILLLFEFVCKFLFSLIDAASGSQYLIHFRKWIYVTPFALFVSILLLIFIVSTIRNLSTIRYSLGRLMNRHG